MFMSNNPSGTRNRDARHRLWVDSLRVCCHDLSRWSSIDLRACLKDEATREVVLVGRCRVCGGEAVRKPLGATCGPEDPIDHPAGGTAGGTIERFRGG